MATAIVDKKQVLINSLEISFRVTTYSLTPVLINIDRNSINSTQNATMPNSTISKNRASII